MKPEIKVETLPESERALLQEAFAIAQETGIKTVDFAAQRLKAVLTIGHTLNHWRAKVAKDHWYSWLDANVFPMVEITVRSLTNWMRLADAERLGKVDVKAGVGVRTALIQAGIIPGNDKAATTGQPRVKGDPAIIIAIVRLAHQIGRLGIAELSDQQRQTILAALQPIVRLHNVLAALSRGNGKDAPDRPEMSRRGH